MLATLTLAAVLAAPIPKEPPVDPPKAGPPTLLYFKSENGVIGCQRAVTETVQVQREVEVTVLQPNGQQVKEKRTVPTTQAVTKMVLTKVSDKAIEFATAGGRKQTYQEAA